MEALNKKIKYLTDDYYVVRCPRCYNLQIYTPYKKCVTEPHTLCRSCKRQFKIKENVIK